uniref:Uncharacterized protein n=1 Tax=Physcomitrium patens TaxID=3218 RepID=A0A2K1IMY4_PHYPA|nr:hypothetical protein PHYPA_026951 [Physcomitrium patens]
MSPNPHDVSQGYIRARRISLTIPPHFNFGIQNKSYSILKKHAMLRWAAATISPPHSILQYNKDQQNFGQ